MRVEISDAMEHPALLCLNTLSNAMLEHIEQYMYTAEYQKSKAMLVVICHKLKSYILYLR